MISAAKIIEKSDSAKESDVILQKSDGIV